MNLETQKILKSLLKLNKDENRVFVFDIDSTLYDVTPRNQEIVRHFGETKVNEDQLKSKLINFNSKSNDWGIKEGLLRLNLKSLNDTIIKSIKSHWNEYFFSKEFLHLDKEYPGAVAYLNALNEISPVYYLTGRDTSRMGEGTIVQLKNSKFPSDSNRNKLILKPDKSLLDHEYKLEELKKLKDSFKDIHFFDNEPVILNTVHDNNPEIKIYFVDSVNSGRANIYPHITSIKPIYL
jgi:FMN phosphatase YigB (HAD superfamily)